MLKLLVVDDERLDREGLLRQLDWDQYDIGTVLTANNGYEALEVIATEKPDIMLTDVKMPGMSGLQLAEKVRKAGYAVKIIFVSGYDDFDFVKNAIKLNAYEYILKPVDTEELIVSVSKAVTDILKERQQEEEKRTLLHQVNESKPLLRKKLLEELIYGTADKDGLWEQIRHLELTLLPGKYMVLLIEIDDFLLLKGNLPDTELDEKIENLQKDIRRYSVSSVQMESIRMEEARIVLLAGFPERCTEEAVLDLADNMGRGAIHEAAQKAGFSVTIGMGSVVDSLLEVHRSYGHCCAALMKKIFEGKGTILYSEADSPMQSGDINFENIDVELAKCLLNHDLARACHLLDYMFDRLEEQRVSDGRYIQNYCINIISRLQITLMDINEKVESVFGPGVILWEKLMKFETIVDIRQWMKNIFHAVIEYLVIKNESRSSKIIEEVARFVEQNYQREITLREIAEKLFYSPNYLGSIFKQETGHGFIEYLTEFRIRKAAELLGDPKLKTYEVAGMVGYKTIPSFIKQFKAVFGITPTEYRERC